MVATALKINLNKDKGIALATNMFASAIPVYTYEK